MKNRRLTVLALLPGLFAPIAGACPVTLSFSDAGGGQPLRIDFDRSEYRDLNGAWRSLAGRCENGAASAHCRLETRCGPHQFLLRVEQLTGLTTAAVLQGTALLPGSGWISLSSGQSLTVGKEILRARAASEAGTRRVTR